MFIMYAFFAFFALQQLHAMETENVRLPPKKRCRFVQSKTDEELLAKVRNIIANDIDKPVDKNGNTELFYAVEEGNIQKVQSLLTEGANANRQNCWGNTPLFWAVIFDDNYPVSNTTLVANRIQIIKLLVANGAKPSHRNELGQSLRDVISSNAPPDLITTLDDIGAPAKQSLSSHHDAQIIKPVTFEFE